MKLFCQFLTVIAMSFSVVAVAQPSNDNCASAEFLAVGSSCVVGDFTTIGATGESGLTSHDPSCGAFQGADVWFTFTVPTSGDFRIEASGGSTRWTLLQGSCGLFNEIVCTSGDRNFSDPSLAGQTLYLQVWRFNSTAGSDFDLCIWEIDPPSNNSCSTPTNITVGASCVTESYSCEFATAEDEAISFDPSCGAFQGGDVWFTFTVPASGDFRIEVSGGSIWWTLLQGSCGSFSEVRCTNGARNFSDPSLAGQTLYLQVFRFNSDQGNPFDICVWEIDPPANNSCSSPTNISVGIECTTQAFSNEFSTEEDPGIAFSPSCGAFQGGDVWFTFTVPASGNFRVDADGSAIWWTLLQGSCGSFSEIRCTNGAKNFSDPSLAGETLYLQVYRFNSEQGNPFDLCIWEIDPPSNNNCDSPTNITVSEECTFQSFSNEFSTVEDEANSFEPTCGAFQGGDVWFTFTVPASGNFRIDVDGSSIWWTLLQGSCGAFTELRCTNGPRNFSDPTLAGQTLYLQVFRFNSEQGNPFDLCISEITPPSNNNCSNPTLLAVGDSCESVTYSSEFATGEGTDISANPSCGSYQGGDVWLRFLAPDNGSFTIEKVNNSAWYTILTGSCGNFTEYLCDNDPVIEIDEPALGGQLITLRVFRFNSDQGNEFELCITADDVAPNDNCADAIPLTVGSNCTPELFNTRNTTFELNADVIPPCGGFQGKDIWFTATVPTSGRLGIDFDYLIAGPFNAVIYSGSCGSLEPIACLTNPNDEIVDLETLIGQTIYLRVYRRNSNIGTDFLLCLSEVDCNGDAGGTAFVDDCEICAGGNTGVVPCGLDCQSDFGGTATIDDCGVCVLGTSISIISRDGLVNVQPTNLGYIPGFEGTPSALTFSNTGVTSSDDIFTNGGLYYGPDGFGRINNGTYRALQDIRVNPSNLRVNLEQSSSAYGEASPQSLVDNDVEILFTVSTDISVTLNVEFDGDTNIGDDEISFLFREVEIVEGEPEFLSQLFTTATANDGGDNITTTLNLLAGSTYQWIIGGKARSLNNSAVSSFIDVNMSFDTPNYIEFNASCADCAGVPNGSAFNDLCEECVGGTTGLEPCCPVPFPALDESALSTQLNPSSVSIGWESVLGQVGCQIQLRLAGSGSLLGSAIAGGNTDSFTIPGSVLEINQDYEWRVRCGCSQSPLVAGPFTSWQPFSTDLGASIVTSPNPTSDHSNISFEADFSDRASIAVFDMNGRQVAQLYSGEIEADQSYRFTFDTSGLPNGLYVCRYTGSEQTYLTKILVAH